MSQDDLAPDVASVDEVAARPQLHPIEFCHVTGFSTSFCYLQNHKQVAQSSDCNTVFSHTSTRSRTFSALSGTLYIRSSDS